VADHELPVDPGAVIKPLACTPGWQKEFRREGIEEDM
jgi:hypothetical protein